MRSNIVFRCILAVGVLLLVVPTELVAQSGHHSHLRGRVTDSEGSPVVGGRVSLPLENLTTVTGPGGRFQLRGYTGNSTVLTVSAPGHRSVSLEIVAPMSGLEIVLERTPHELPTVTVTAGSREELRTVPGATATVDTRVLQERAPVSVADALRTVPGIQTADEDPFGLNLNIGFRGLPPRRSARTLLMEDGVPILLGPYGDPTMHYAPPVESLERIEIVKGSGQITNGPQTVGGVVNFVTRGPPTEGTFGHARLGGGGLGYRNGHVWLGTGASGRGLSLDYTFREGDGLRREHGHRFHNVLLGGVLNLRENQTVLLKGSAWNEASRISETGLTREEFERDPFSLPFTIHDRFDVRRYQAQAVHEVRTGSTKLRTHAYITHTDRASWRQSGESEERLGLSGYEEDFNCSSGATSYLQCGNQGRPRQYLVMAVEPRLAVAVTRGPVEGEANVGLRLYREDVRRRQYVGNTPTSREADARLTRDNQISTSAVSTFVQTRLRAGALELSPALRVERIAQDIHNRFPGREAAGSQQYTRTLPGIGMTYGAATAATLFAGVHRGFAPPRPADVYRPEPGQPIVLVDPETSWNWEVGSRYTGTWASAEATLFQIDFLNQIVEAPAGSGQRFINGGRALHRGVELSGGLDLGAITGPRDDVRLDAAFTYLPVARFTGADSRGAVLAGKRLPYAPRRLASAGVTFGHRSGLSLGAAAEYTADQYADKENTIEASDDGQTGLLPAYTVVHAFTGYAIPRTRLQLRSSVRNVFDRVYITQRNEGIYTGMRRFARAELQWTF